MIWQQKRTHLPNLYKILPQKTKHKRNEVKTQQREFSVLISQARDRLCQSLSKSTFDAVLLREAEPYSQLPFIVIAIGHYSKIILTLTIQND